MRGSGWLLPIGAGLLWVAAAGYPIIAAGMTLVTAEAGGPRVPVVGFRPAWVLLAETAGYATIVAIGAVMCGWGPGRVLGRAASGRGYAAVAASMLLPICMPAYVVFYAWWQSWPADSALHAWAIEQGLVTLLKRVTLVAGLVCWSWPLVAWCVAGSAALTPGVYEEMLRLDGAGPVRRLAHRLRFDGGGLAIGGLLVFLAAFNNTTCFDLAGVFTFGNELRAKDAMGSTAGEVLTASLPAAGLAATGAAGIWLLLAGRPQRQAMRTASSGTMSRVASVTIWVGSVLVPLVLLVRGLGGWAAIERFTGLYARSVVWTSLTALVSAAVGVVVAWGLAMAWGDHRRWVRAAGHVQAIGWLAMAVVPGTVVGVALEAGYNLPVGVGGVTLADVVYREPGILVLGHLARFGFVAALLGRWVAAREPRALGEMRRLDGAQALGALLWAGLPRLLGAGVASFAIVFVFALGELPVTARVHPPGSDPLAVNLLNAMHYQRPQTVIVAALVLVGLAMAAAVVTAGAWAVWRRAARGGTAVGAVLFAMLLLSGCGDDGEGAAALRTRFTFGATGISLGQFHYPRCIAIDEENGFVYVIDKTARVQRFGLDGTPQRFWPMPEKAAGKPTGVSVSPDGEVYVADTHYYRVIAYTADGDEVMRFGGYGEGPGQFIYPTDIAFGPEGRLYVSEYGGNDRVQVFNEEGAYLFEFGEYGEGWGEFNRPQSLVFDEEMTELYIADACNHRIVVTSPAGEWLGSIGEAGTEAGRLFYPYGLAVAEDGTLFVCEFGSNRVQRFSAEGEALGQYGRLGAGVGELRYPWGVAVTAAWMYVLDSGNNRVQAARRP